MKSMYIIIIWLFLLSCKSTSVVKNDITCIENTEFKEKFFLRINYIEENISIRQDNKFKETLEELSKYVHISFDKMANYARTYPIGVFEEDKKGWLVWYEKNKCNNLQW